MQDSFATVLGAAEGLVRVAGKDRAAAQVAARDEAAAISPVRAPAVTAFAPSAARKSRMSPVSAVRT